MLAYLITLEDDDGTLLATSPAGPAVDQPVALRKGQSVRRALLCSTSAQDLETVILLGPFGRR